MYVQPNQNNVNMRGKNHDPNFWKRLKQKALDAIPDMSIKDGKNKIERWEKINEIISRPAENRLIMGATAMITQPAIDYYNHKVDKETREVSKNRTIAKIIAGTTVGIAVRGTSYKLVNKMTDPNGKSKFSKSLLPSNQEILKGLFKEPKFLKNYRNALSTILAIAAMCITNFVIDAPLTAYLTNYFNKKSSKKAEITEERRAIYG